MLKRLTCVAAAAVLLPICAGCDSSGVANSIIGGGGNEGSSLAAHADTLTADEAYHLLTRAAFGAPPQQVDSAVRRGLAATVDDLLTKEEPPEALLTLEATYENDIPKRWLVHMIDGPNPLHERLALFWHDRFATSRRVLSGRDSALALTHWNMLRSNALGNYREFLADLTIDPLMLIWLDGANSPKDNPNENYTREFWELFTLGRDVLYTEDDIREGARAFTGITLLRENGEDARPIYDIINHDETTKHVFPGREPAANHDYLSVIDMTLRQDESPAYVARNLFTFFVHDYPSDAVIRDLANTLVDSDFEIAPVVRRILMSQAFFSEEARGSRIASPVEHVIGVFRSLDMHVYSEDAQGSILDRLARDLREAGQELLNPPGVEGWAEGEAWLQDQWIFSRVDALGRSMEFGPERTPELPYHLLPSRSTWAERESRQAIVEALAGVFHLTLTEEEIAIYIEVLDQNGWRAFHLEEPDNQPRHVHELIRLLAMHEDVLSR